MALPYSTGPLDVQLYGDAPDLTDTAIPPTTNADPWSWVPPEWDVNPDDQLRQHLATQGAPQPGQPPPGAAPPPGELAAPTLPAPVDVPGPAAIPAPAAPPPPTSAIPAPDAITGAGGMPAPPPIEAERLDVSPTTIADQWARDPLHGPEADARAYAEQATPVQLLDQQRKIDQARQTKLVLDQARVDEENLRQLKADQDARARADVATKAQSDQIVADAMKLAHTKIDPDRWMSTRTGGQRIAAFISAIGGGLVQGRTGAARNQGMDAIQMQIDRDIDAQKHDIETGKYGIAVRQNAVAQEYQRTGNLYQAAETMRLATYQAAINKMQTEQQNFDPEGTGWVRYGMGIQDMKARAAAANESMRRNIFDENYKVAQLDVQRENARREAAKTKADQALGWARLAEDKRQREQAALIHREEKQAVRDDKAAEDERKLSIGTLPRLKVDADGKPALDDRGAPVVESGALKQRSGKTFLAPDDMTRKTLADKTLAASEVADIINQVLDIRDKVGGESRAFNSDEKQKLDVLQNRLVVLAKAGTQGMSSDEDMKKLSASLGADDVSSFRARAAGLIEGRDRATAEINKAYRIAGYDGAPIEFPNKYGAAPKNTLEEDRLQRLLEKPGVTFDNVFGAELRKRELGLSPDQLHPDQQDRAAVDAAVAEDQARIKDAYQAARSSYDPGASPEQQQQIAELASAAAGKGPASVAALKVLHQVATSAPTTRLRQLAKGAIESAILSDGATPEEIR